MWRLDSEINDKSSVGFWMGVARVGRYVAQVNFTPSGDNDVDEDTFQALITRARDRLFELPASGAMSGFELTEGLVYLDGNSLGALPSGVAERMQDVVRREWGEGLIRSWNDAQVDGAQPADRGPDRTADRGLPRRRTPRRQHQRQPVQDHRGRGPAAAGPARAGGGADDVPDRRLHHRRASRT